VKTWPDDKEQLLRSYVAQLDLADSVFSRRPYESVFRRFQRYIVKHADGKALSLQTIAGWLREEMRRSTLRMAIRRAQLVTGFLDWLVTRGHLAANPIAEVRKECRRRSTAAIVRALLDPNPSEALKKLRGLPRFGSHLGPAICDHLQRMRNLGFRYEEQRLRRFDEFLQTRSGAEGQPLDVLVKEYATLASTPAEHIERLKVGRVLLKSLDRVNPGLGAIEQDPMVKREALRRRCRPYIFTVEEIERLLSAALRFPSPHAPLRPLVLYTMFVLAYCAGLRMGEIVHLRVGDIRLDEHSLDIRDTKFFKSRRLPLSTTAMTVLRRYLQARQEAGIPSAPDTPLFCHKKGGYAYITANHLLRRVLRFAGLKTGTGRVGPRIHDVRHCFVVHRMTEWYRKGVDPQAKLPYLWTYLGHRGLDSSLVYMTITQELLERANDRFHSFAAPALRGSTENL
jgi:integrase/recombinase XerD